MDDFDVAEYKQLVAKKSVDELQSLLHQLGRNGETSTSRVRQTVIQDELESRQSAEAPSWVP